jgi:dihydrofolate synthase/folylpolyglutamate synthase
VTAIEPLQRLFALETFGIKLGLENISRLCEALGHPERAFTTLHVAGTNGKGSVTAMVHAGLVAAGVRAARYTSPHLVDLAERFVIGREPIDHASLAETARDVLDCADALAASGTLAGPPTFFEASTAIAFELFRRARVEAAVIEVGLGGRFDATNVISPAATAITSIGLDHQEQLGSTVGSVAFEKAGIIKRGTPVVVGRLPATAHAVIERVAAERGAPLVRAADEVTVTVKMQAGRATLDVTTPRHDYGPLTLALRGEHQVDNALVAIRLAEVAHGRGLAFLPGAVARGLTDVTWPARLELMTLAERRILLDAAHNPDGAAALARYLTRWHPERPPLVFAAMRDKDVEGMLRALLPAVGEVVVTTPPTPRAADARELAARVRALARGRRVEVVDEPLAAVELALEYGHTICVAGSIYLAGAVRGALQARAILNEPRGSAP